MRKCLRTVYHLLSIMTAVVLMMALIGAVQAVPTGTVAAHEIASSEAFENDLPTVSITGPTGTHNTAYTITVTWAATAKLCPTI